MFFYERALRRGDVGHFTGFARSELHLGQPEIKDLRVAALGHKNVRRLDVAMDYAFTVRRIERVSNLNTQRQDRFPLHGTAGNQVLERRPVKKFHDEKSASVFLANVVHGADVGMVESGSGLRFAAETLQRLPILGKVLRKKFQRDEAAEACIFSLINHPHAAATEFLDDPVMGDGVPEQGKVSTLVVEQC